MAGDEHSAFVHKAEGWDTVTLVCKGGMNPGAQTYLLGCHGVTVTQGH
jgi:hypothetical protein